MRVLITTLFFSLTVLASQAQNVEDIVAEITEAIELNEAQSAALASQMEKYTISLQLIFDKYEQGEPDPQAMLNRY